MFSYLILFAAIVAVKGRFIDQSYPCPAANETDVDKLINDLRLNAIMNNLDPLSLSPKPEREITFHYLLTNHKGTLSVSDGYLLSVSALELAGEQTVTCTNGVIDILLPIIIPRWTSYFFYNVKSGIYTPEGTLNFVTEGLRAELQLSLDLNNAVANFVRFTVISHGSTVLTIDPSGGVTSALGEPILYEYLNSYLQLVIDDLSNAWELAIPSLPVDVPTTTTTETTSTTRTTPSTTASTTATTQVSITTTEVLTTSSTEAPTSLSTIPVTEAPTSLSTISVTEAPTSLSTMPDTEAPTTAEAPISITEAPTTAQDFTAFTDVTTDPAQTNPLTSELPITLTNNLPV